MTNIQNPNTNTTKVVEQFLSLVPQFNQLPPEAIAQIAPNLKPLRFGVGKSKDYAGKDAGTDRNYL